MSRYKMIATEFRNLESLKQALTLLEIPFDLATNPTEPNLPMFGYHNDRRPESASIAIRKTWVNKHWSNTASFQGNSNDIGFAWDGQQYAAIVSDYDEGRPGVIQAMDKLRQQYSLIELRRQAYQRGYTVQERPLPDGSVQLRMIRR